MSHSSTSTHKSSPLPSLLKQSNASPTINADRKSARSLPLTLTFNQLHQSPLVLNRRKPSRLSICPISEHSNKENLSLMNNKLSTTTRSSIASTTTISLLSIKAESRSPHEDSNRLNSPQLRRLNVSEKYINEAKKLYYNPEWKIFTPRALITQVF